MLTTPTTRALLVPLAGCSPAILEGGGGRQPIGA